MSELAQLLTGRDARQALARHDIAAVYRVLGDAGVSQARIAHATGQSQSEVSAVLSGRQVRSVTVLERIADGLGVPHGWMGLAYTSSHEAGEEPSAGDDGEEELRQNLLRHAATVLFGVPVFGVARPILVRDVSTPRSRCVGASDIAWFTSAKSRLSKLSDDLGGIALSDAMTAHAQVGEALLGADMRHEVRLQLNITLAKLHNAAGWAASDAGMRDRARWHYARGMSCGAAAGDKPQVSTSLCCEGRAELQFGDPDAALKLFQLGAATAPSQLVRAQFEYSSALALARLGHPEEMGAAMRRAQYACESASDSLPEADFHIRSLSHLVGIAHSMSGRFEMAVPEFIAATDAADHAVRCSTLNLSELATAQLRAGDLGSGVQTAVVVVGKAKGLRSVWVRERLGPLQKAAAARHDSTCQDLARELAKVRALA